MPLYRYRAVDNKTGQIITYKIEDSSRKNVIKRLMKNGYSPITINAIKQPSKKKKKRNVIDPKYLEKNFNFKEINSKTEKKRHLNYILQTKIEITDIIVFTQNFYLLKKANFNNIHALSTLINSIENVQFREIVEDILIGVQAGENIYTTMEYYSDVFPPIYVNMIKVGELSGSLTNSLEQALQYLEQTTSLKKKIRDIIIPNLIEFVGILLLLIAGILIAIPQIQNLFDTIGTKEQLPAITIGFSNFLNLVIAYWYIPVIIIISIVVIMFYRVNTVTGKYRFHMFKYTMPIFGKLIFALDMQKYLKALHLNILNGMRLQDAIEVSKNVVKNYVMLSIIETSKNNLIIGESWITPFEESNLCPTMITEMLKIGMQTDLGEMLYKTLNYMEVDIKNLLDKIIRTLPQVVTVIVGILLIFFVIVVLVPLIQVYMGTFLFSAYGY